MSDIRVSCGSSKRLNDSLVRSADLHPPKMLQDERMAGLVKLRRSARPRSERQVRADHVETDSRGSQLCTGNICALLAVKARTATERFCKMLWLRRCKLSVGSTPITMYHSQGLPDVLVNAWSTRGYNFDRVRARARSLKAGETR